MYTKVSAKNGWSTTAGCGLGHVGQSADAVVTVFHCLTTHILQSTVLILHRVCDPTIVLTSSGVENIRLRIAWEEKLLGQRKPASDSLPHPFIQHRLQLGPEKVGGAVLDCSGLNKTGTQMHGPRFCMIRNEEVGMMTCKGISMPKLSESAFRGNYRLGNLLDRWWVQQYEGKDFILNRSYSAWAKGVGTAAQEFRHLGRKSPQCSFGNFLLTHPPSQPTTTIAKTQKNFPGRKGFKWWMYSYAVSSDVQIEFGQSLREALKEFEVQTGTVVPMYNSPICVVHYRLGDVLRTTRYGTLSPSSMGREIYRWAILKNLTIKEFHVLGSGNTIHNTNDQTTIAISQQMLLQFCTTVQTFFPNARVYIDVSGQPDEDFIKMVSAPMLFTSHGSFAMAALLANTGQKAS
eukprot:CAMPEP_0179444554 /NCGR_PEP_ID=MMETSP0799-20121207/27990_1 /TAXON_ID=46947 /ORGANISM="Geminigera cryophila, Strain CCMP2564" /LENGTH=403 /DNA_ID=CAMNT_0021231693 /DNA_START=143 /DNA_END=1352 /DNA_ORIENTATION=-